MLERGKGTCHLVSPHSYSLLVGRAAESETEVGRLQFRIVTGSPGKARFGEYMKVPGEPRLG